MNKTSPPLCRYCLQPTVRRANEKGWENYCSPQCRISARAIDPAPLKAPGTT